jgi:hypothetical protein
MSVKDLANIAQSSLCVAAIVFVLFKFWSEARLDAFRQKMFALRDEVFDFAANGEIAFDSPAYRLLRQSMNGMIRYAHQLTFFRVCITHVEINILASPPKTEWSEKWARALEGLPTDEARKKMIAFHARAMDLVMYRLIFGSPLLLGLVVAAVPVVVLRMGWQNLKVTAQKASTATFSRVVDTRMIENEAAAA